jgi:peptidyl-prolyl cis-trans isomerase SurA
MTDHLPTTFRLSALAALLLSLPLLWSGAAQAQALQPASPAAAPRPATAPGEPRTADFIVALVNSEPVTNHDVRQRLLRVEQQIGQQGAARPPRDELARQVLEQLVNERAQLQQAAELGIKVDDATLAQAEQSVAAQNEMTLEAFRRRVAAEGIELDRLRSDLRNQILLQRVREREVESRVRVTEADIDDFIRDQRSNPQVSALVLNLSHVLVRVPEGAGEEQVRALQARAQEVAERARAGADFAALAREFSDAPEGASGGQFGPRPAERLPELFVQSTRTLPAGGVAGPVRSEAGFHVLKVLEKSQGGVPDAVVTQTRARHVLLRPTPQLSAEAAAARLSEYRQQIVGGQRSFQDVAREHSQDGSAREGGDLGWASPGQFVPEFEEAMNALKVGEISQPLRSRFGVHLIRVDERRESALSQREQREIVRGLLREQKADEALLSWAQDVRGRAFVEFREAPRP